MLQALQYDVGASAHIAASLGLTIIFCVIIAWFVVQNFVLEKYTRFTFMEHIVFVVATSGIMKRQWKDGHGNQAYILVTLIVSCLFFITRIVLILVKERQVLVLKDKDTALEIE